jgi:acyl carrier protein
MADTRERLKQIFRSSFGLSNDAEVVALEYRGAKEWDSMGHMQLVAAIEIEFSIMLETDDVLNLSSFDKAVEIVGRYVA